MEPLPPAGAVLRSALGAARYRLTGHRIPLAVTLVVTHRCDALCTHCVMPLRPVKELDTRAWVEIIDAVAAEGGVRVGFTGGEPLVRPDLGALVRRCHEHALWTTLETNGHTLPARLPELAGLGRVMIPLEGRQEAHDRLREPGSWEKARAGIRAAREVVGEVATVTTLTRHNLDELPWILDHADETGTTAVFQLLAEERGLAPRDVHRLRPSPVALTRALRGLLEARHAGRRVGMSEKLLRYLLTWEDFRHLSSPSPHEDVHCVAGQLHCAVDADGTMLPCTLLGGRHAGVDVTRVGFAAAFAELRDNGCRACASTPLVEYNFLYNLSVPAILDRLRAAGPPPVPPKRRSAA